MAGTKGISNKQLEKIDELEVKKLKKNGLGKGDSAKVEKLEAMDQLNEKQRSNLSSLIEKRDEVKGLTSTQASEYSKLIKLRDDPLELSKGAKTHLRKLRREIKFGRRKELKNQYLSKGVIKEEDAITFLTLWHGDYFVNNKERVENKFFSGEVDVIEMYDTKCSWEMDSLPDPEEPLPMIYEYQNRVYMMLHNAEQWTTSAILFSIIPSAMEDKIYREGFEPEWKGSNLPNWRKLELISFYTYTEKDFWDYMVMFDCEPEPDDLKSADVILNFVELPDYERIVEKTTYRDKDIEELMVQVVKLARIYLQEQDQLMMKGRVLTKK